MIQKEFQKVAVCGSRKSSKEFSFFVFFAKNRHHIDIFRKNYTRQKYGYNFECEFFFGWPGDIFDDDEGFTRHLLILKVRKVIYTNFHFKMKMTTVDFFTDIENEIQFHSPTDEFQILIIVPLSPKMFSFLSLSKHQCFGTGRETEDLNDHNHELGWNKNYLQVIFINP